MLRCERGAEWRLSHLTPAAAVPAAGRRGVLHVLALGDGQVIEDLVRGGRRRSGEGRRRARAQFGPGPGPGAERGGLGGGGGAG